MESIVDTNPVILYEPINQVLHILYVMFLFYVTAILYVCESICVRANERLCLYMYMHCI